MLNVGQLIGYNVHHPSGSLVSAVAGLPLADVATSSDIFYGSPLVWIVAATLYAATAKTGAFATKKLKAGVKNYRSARMELFTSQDAFWKHILPDEYTRDCAVITGGGQKAILDVVRGNRIPEAARYQLLRTIAPIISAGAEHLDRYLADRLDEIFNVRRNPSAIPTLGALASQLEHMAGLYNWKYSRVKFLSHLPLTKRKLLLPLGGPITNDLTRDHMLKTQSLRKYHIVARRGQPDTPLILSSLDAVDQIRREKQNCNDLT